MAKVIAATSIQTSPIANDIFKSLEGLPFVISQTTPVATRIMPIPLFIVSNSRNKIRDRMTMNTGNVIDINERLMAVVV